MNTLRLSFYLFVTFMCIQCSNSNPTPDLPYFNQEPPGILPKVFAPDHFASADFRLHGFPTFSPDGHDVYWPVIPPYILHMHHSDGQWSSSEKASFSERNIQACFLAANKKLYFQLYDSTGHGSLDIWHVEKIDSNWSEKTNLGSPPNSDQLESQPTLTDSGTLYFCGALPGVTWNRGIYRAPFKNGKFDTVQTLPPVINSEFIDYTPFIAADESFLLFASSRPSTEENRLRLYVSFRNGDSWSEPFNLNELMYFDHPSRFPSITPDGKYLVFLSEGKYYWASSDIIRKVKELIEIGS